MIDAVRGLAPGRYVAGNSLLHRWDPRLKLLTLPLLMTAVFTAGWLRLALLSLLLLALVRAAGFPVQRCWRLIRALRWLLLCTLLLHLLFSPGRTLLGSTWLSYDGLLLGLQVCWRLVAALLYASLLTQTTPPGEMAAALAWLLRPLVLVGVATNRIAEFLFLTLSFFPILEEEATVIVRANALGLSSGPLLQRGQAAGRLIEPLTVALFDRADALARRSAQGDAIVPEVNLPPFCATAYDRAWVVATAILLPLVWMV